MLPLDLTNARNRGFSRLADPVLWCLLATIYCVLVPLGLDVAALADNLGDSDDAMRLVSVRDLVAGQSWFDLTSQRVGAPEPLLSHWSRLVDLPLATGLVILRPLLGAAGAELAVRILWPAFLLFALLLVLARDAIARGGLLAGAFAVILAVTSDSALVQFRPGRVDHHNLQVLCAVAGVLLLARSLKLPRLGAAAGLFFGLGLAVGLEALPLTVPALGLAAVLALIRPRLAPGLRAAAIATAATLLAAFVLTVPPSRWLDMRCDTLSLNLVLLALAGAGGLWMAFQVGATSAARFAIAGLCTAAGLAIYAAFEPACLAGPMGQLNPALKPIWLDEVVETFSVAWLLANHPAAGLTFLAFILAGVAAQLDLLRRTPDETTAFSTAIVVLAVLLGCWQMRLMSYASWLAIPPLALWCASLPLRTGLSSRAAAMGAVLLLSQAFLGAVMTTAVAAVRHVAPAASGPARPDLHACYRFSSLKPLAALPKGLVAADIDLGSFVVAATDHRVVAAPYHRLGMSIVANQRILEGTPDDARREMAALGIDYLALCAVAGQKTAPGSLRGLLLSGQSVPFLREVEAPPGSPIEIWRVVRGE